jgi:sulfur-oxidizing protein SoxY
MTQQTTRQPTRRSHLTPLQPTAVQAQPDGEPGWRSPASPPSRRTLVIAAAGAACSAWGWGGAGSAHAQTPAGSTPAGPSALAPPDTAAFRESPELRAALARFSGPAVPVEGGVQVDIPELVENGNAVPVTVQVDSPMSAADHVVAIALFTGRNPLPEVAEFRLGPANGVARVSTRIRLATSQKVVAAARMADGRVRTRHVDVLVTLAACVEG